MEEFSAMYCRKLYIQILVLTKIVANIVLTKMRRISLKYPLKYYCGSHIKLLFITELKKLVFSEVKMRMMG